MPAGVLVAGSAWVGESTLLRIIDASGAAGRATDERFFKILGASAIGLILGGATIMYRLLEGWSWVDSFYFSVVAVSTVGFGDIRRSTDASKLFTVVCVLGGISIITTYLHARTGRRVERRYDV